MSGANRPRPGLAAGLAAIALTVLSLPALAQTNAGEGERQRAPLAIPDDLAPTVDVGGRAATPAVPPAAPAADPAPQAPAAAPGQPIRAGNRTATIDTLDLGTTSITGNQELPKVLYIVPWKRSDLGDIAGRPVNTLLDEVLAPIDPEVFERQLNYFDSLHGTTAKE